jgi:hypothetical protein
MARGYGDNYEAEDDDSVDEDDDAIVRHLPSREDMDSSDEPGADACPYCNKLISEDAEQCPHCGQYISAEDAPSRAPVWIWIVTVVLLAVFFFTLF